MLSPVKALAFIAVQQAVFSLYLGISFAPNHKGMPIIETAAATSFARRQVVTARNITGGRFTDFMLGGLNYQIEHHLFPSMPRPNLRRVQGLVRDFCVAADLCYREEASSSHSARSSITLATLEQPAAFRLHSHLEEPHGRRQREVPTGAPAVAPDGSVRSPV